MKFINDRDEQYLREQFEKELEQNVNIVFFTQSPSKIKVPEAIECQYCEETGQLLAEVVNLSDKIKLETHDIRVEPDSLKNLGVDLIPAVVLTADSAARVRYFGIPSGYEFMSLIEDLIDISRGTTDLSDKTRERLKALNKNVHIQVFVTPT